MHRWSTTNITYFLLLQFQILLRDRWSLEKHFRNLLKSQSHGFFFFLSTSLTKSSLPYVPRGNLLQTKNCCELSSFLLQNCKSFCLNRLVLPVLHSIRNFFTPFFTSLLGPICNFCGFLLVVTVTKKKKQRFVVTVLRRNRVLLTLLSKTQKENLVRNRCKWKNMNLDNAWRALPILLFTSLHLSFPSLLRPICNS